MNIGAKDMEIHDLYCRFIAKDLTETQYKYWLSQWNITEKQAEDIFKSVLFNNLKYLAGSVFWFLVCLVGAYFLLRSF